MKKLSIIIPCNDLQEVVTAFLPHILSRISDRSIVELIFVDSFEREEVREYIENSGCRYASANMASRAVQCNLGAATSESEYLFFLHIDSIPPADFDLLILDAFRQKAESGCFRLKFDIRSRFLSAFCWFTRFKWIIARGGDQGLFISRKCFYEIDGYDENLRIMEDIDICHKLLKRGTFKILTPELVTSARKYQKVGTFKLQFLFIVITIMYWCGFSNEKIFRFYKTHIK